VPKIDTSTLAVQLENQGRELTRVKSWEIDADYLVSTDGFRFDCYADDLALVRGLEMQPVNLLVGGASQLIGRIDMSTMGTDGLAVSYEGRDYIADMVECAIDPTVTLKERATLESAVTSVAGTVGISKTVSDIDFALRNVRTGKQKGVQGGKDFRALTLADVKPDYGTGQYEFLNRLCARHGCTIQPANARDTVSLTAPNYSQSANYRIVRRIGQGRKNNVISAQAVRNYGTFPTFLLFNASKTRTGETTVPVTAPIGIGFRSQPIADAIGEAGATTSPLHGLFYVTRAGFDGTKKYSTAEAAAGFSPSAADVILGACHIGRRKPTEGPHDPRRLYRLMAYRDSESRNQAQIERAAVRAMGEQLKETLSYTVTVQGHIDPESGAVWSIDTIVDVLDEVCDISEPLWIHRRTLRFDETSGATTELHCWRPGAFLL
jgi:hypothetical protein